MLTSSQTPSMVISSPRIFIPTMADEPLVYSRTLSATRGPTLSSWRSNR